MTNILSFTDIRDNVLEKRKAILEIMNEYLSKHTYNGKKESLKQHSISTLNVFLTLNDKYNEQIYNNILKRMINNTEKINLIKEAILESILFHDIGKLNPYFQKSCHTLNLKLSEKIKSEHSIYSYIILMYLWKNTLRLYDDYFLFLVSSIFKMTSMHHTSLDKFNYESLINELKDLHIIADEDISIEILSKLDLISDVELNLEIKNINIKRFRREVLKNIKNENLFYLLKLLYSQLVISDFYSTFKYQYNIKSDFELNYITQKLLNKMETSYYKTKSYNKLSLSFRLKDPEELNNINDLRTNLLVSARKNLEKLLSKDHRIFMLNIPTGGGKTNIGINLMLEIIKKMQLKRAFWVFPYINIIEQNYEVIKETLNIDKEIKKVQYNDYTLSSSNEMEEYINYLDFSWLNNPINVISNVNFFDTFIKNRKNNRYKPAMFTNSVVIIDEIQTLDIYNMDLFYKLIYDLSENYNIYFIIMSATLPDVNDFVNVKENKIPHIIDNYENYFGHTLFKRNKIIFPFKEYEKIKSIEVLVENIIRESKEYNKILVVVNTIESSVRVFEYLKNSKKIETHDILLLNSTIKNKDRNAIINHIKNINKVILVSTQTVEAGVDLDFDMAFRDNAPIDSLEQISGRVNRSCDLKKTEKSKVIITYLRDENGNYFFDKVYNEYKMRFQKDKIEEIAKILKNKNFKKYYKLLNSYVSRTKESEGKDYILKLKLLRFKDISKEINIIDNRFRTLTLYDNSEINIIDEKLKNILRVSKATVSYILKKKRVLIKKDPFIHKPYIKIIDSELGNLSFSLNVLYEYDKFVSFLRNNNLIQIEEKEIINEDKVYYAIITDIFKKKYVDFFYLNNRKIEYFKPFELYKDFREHTNTSIILI